jgi:pimeloyl-ACP methyl ester carboxylesterase
MTEPLPQFLDIGEGAARRRIAYLKQDGAGLNDSAGAGPGLVWLQGFKSDMVSTKAAALSEWAAARGLPLTRFDYSGHGQSGGRFEEGTLGRWIDEARAVLETLTQGPQIVIGSSMGGCIALVLLKRLMADAPDVAQRIKALVLIAPAWDMTEELMWKQFPEAVRREIMDKGLWMRPSQYGEPYAITRGLIEDGRRHLIGRQKWNPGRPIAILHGRLDPDVPFAHSQALIANIDGGWARLVEVADGEHRLSRPEDIALLFQLIDSVRR